MEISCWPINKILYVSRLKSELSSITDEISDSPVPDEPDQCLYNEVPSHEVLDYYRGPVVSTVTVLSFISKETLRLPYEVFRI